MAHIEGWSVRFSAVATCLWHVLFQRPIGPWLQQTSHKGRGYNNGPLDRGYRFTYGVGFGFGLGDRTAGLALCPGGGGAINGLRVEAAPRW